MDSHKLLVALAIFLTVYSFPISMKEKYEIVQNYFNRVAVFLLFYIYQL